MQFDPMKHFVTLETALAVSKDDWNKFRAKLAQLSNVTVTPGYGEHDAASVYAVSVFAAEQNAEYIVALVEMMNIDCTEGEFMWDQRGYDDRGIEFTLKELIEYIA